MSTSIRAESPGDHAAIRALLVAAFDTPLEADLVERLRECAAPLIALVAEQRGEILGHIVFSPVTLDDRADLRLMGLAPMAVTPRQQRTGIGSALVRAGIARCRAAGVDALVVLGHPSYYPRFGFVPSVRFGIGSDYEVPEEVFMVLELRPGSLHAARGIAHYHGVFAGL